MIIGKNRQAVIENIKNAAESGDFYRKVEMDDPVLSKEEDLAVIGRYLGSRKKFSFKFKSFFARLIANAATSYFCRDTEIYGLEKVTPFPDGAVITSNHFNPLENAVIRKLVRKCGKKRLNIVSQVTNFAMPGVIGFLMNYADTIPISDDMHYMQREFVSILSSLAEKKEAVLIYPEQEMWFNYRKPRPSKRGAYYYAAKLNVPVISCFVEIIDTDKKDTEEFLKVRYALHILDVIYPDADKSVRDNSIIMAKTDYEQKKAAYERIYKKPLDYSFEKSDIAGWLGNVCRDTGK